MYMFRRWRFQSFVGQKSTNRPGNLGSDNCVLELLFMQKLSCKGLGARFFVCCFMFLYFMLCFILGLTPLPPAPPGDGWHCF